MPGGPSSTTLRASVRTRHRRGGDLLADGGLGVEVEVVEGFAGAEPGVPDALVGAGGVAGRHFPFEDGGW